MSAATDEPNGLRQLEELFRNLSEIPQQVTTAALDAMTEVAMQKIKMRGESMGVRDPESDIHILDTIAPSGKAKITEMRGYKDITFKGTRRRGNTETRNAAIAFINEYGRRKYPARQFIRTAFDADQEAICAPGIDIINGWIERQTNE